MRHTNQHARSKPPRGHAGREQTTRGFMAAIAALALTVTGSLAAAATVEGPLNIESDEAINASLSLSQSGDETLKVLPTPKEESTEGESTEGESTEEEILPAEEDSSVDEGEEGATEELPLTEGRPASKGPDQEGSTFAQESTFAESAELPKPPGALSKWGYATGNGSADYDSPLGWKGKDTSATDSQVLSSDVYVDSEIFTAVVDRASASGESLWAIEVTMAPARWGLGTNTWTPGSSGTVVTSDQWVPQPNRNSGGTVFFFDTQGTQLVYVCTYTGEADYPKTNTSPGCVTATAQQASLKVDGTTVTLTANLAGLGFGSGTSGCPSSTFGSTTYVRGIKAASRQAVSWTAPQGIRPPSTCAPVQVDKKWVIDGVTSDLNDQPNGYSAVPTINQASGIFGKIYNSNPGTTTPLFEEGDPVVIGETILAMPSGCTLTTSIESVSSGAPIEGSDNSWTLNKGLNKFLITNTATCNGNLKITKVVAPEGAPDWAKNTQFSGTYACTLDGSPVANGKWTVKGTGPATLTPYGETEGAPSQPVRLGSSCVVTETPPDKPNSSWNWTTAIAPNPATISSVGPDTTVTVTNTIERVYGHFSVMKVVPEGSVVTEGMEFSGSWSCQLGQETPITGTWGPIKDGETWSSAGTQIPLGSTCTVTEEVRPEFPVTNNHNAYIWYGAPEITPADGVTASNQAPVITVTNRTKQVPGSVTFTKVDEQNRRLAGSKWSLNGPNGFSEMTLSSDDCISSEDLENTNPYCVYTAVGTFKVINLPWGDYTLEETEAPAGYVLQAVEYTFTIDADNLTGTITDTSGNAIVNTKVEGPDLPLTGGQSAALFTILGGGLLAGALGMSALNRRKGGARRA